ncbi:MAG: ASCH domain-containing protein [Bilophila wadsworthia]|uniref:ASCH domain-containing protein n=1 Tax=Bilophila wadsworthia TaxID=35833 RepID=UPI00300E88C8
MEMKALSVRRPFASQIVIGEKTIEWRSKPFNWRGPLVICASKSAIIELDNGKLLPVGMALGIVDVVGCRPMTREDSCCGVLRGLRGRDVWFRMGACQPA